MRKVFLIIISVALFLGTAFSKGEKIPLIGSIAPSFEAESTNGLLTFPDDFGESWKILFSHPRDFTPVCSSEILELAYMQDNFEKLGVKVAVISTDVLSQHKMWKAHLEELDYKGRGTQKIEFPIIEDKNAEASRIYGMLHEPTSTTEDIRGVFIIDSKNIVRSINFYPMAVGRNVAEISRIILALQTTDDSKVFTPANWNSGDDLLIPHFPYTQQQLLDKPELKDEFYNVGNRMWFKKVDK